MTSIKVGVFVPQGWIGDLPSHMSAGEQFRFARGVAVKAEELGFDSIWLFDHLHPNQDVRNPERVTFFECWTMLSALAVETRKVNLGQLVTCNSFRNPSLLAKMAATLDVISNGRLILGMGAGWYEGEYSAYGYPYSRPSVRIRQLDEALQILKEMWAKEKATFQGRHYSIKEAICYPKPLQRPYPKIVVGGSGEKFTLEVVAKHADIWNLNFFSPIVYKQKLEVLRLHCSKFGRDLSTIEKSFLARIVLDEDRSQIRESLKGTKYEGLSIDEYMKIMANRYIAGTVDQVKERLSEYKDIGVTYFMVQLLPMSPDMSSLRTFGSKIMPYLKG